jgi:hypothetical protein
MKKECTHPQDPTNAILIKKSGLKKEPKDIKVAGHHACFDEVTEPDGSVYQWYVHEDCAVRSGLLW